MAEAHVAGADELQLAEGAVHRHGPPVAQQSVKRAHQDQAANETNHRRTQHGDDDLVEDAALVHFGLLGHLLNLAAEDDGGNLVRAELDGVGAVGLDRVTEGRDQFGGGIDEVFAFLLLDLRPFDGTPDADGLAGLIGERRGAVHADGGREDRAGETADDGVGGTAGQAEPPGEEVPKNRAEQGANEHGLGDKAVHHQAAGNGLGHGQPEERAEQIGEGGQDDGLPGRQHLGADDGGDGIGRVMKAVDVFEDQRNDDDREDEK